MKEVIKKENNLVAFKKEIESAIKDIAPKYINKNKLIALVLEARKNPMIAQSSKESLLNFCKKCAEWGTDKIGEGGVWAVPFKNKKLGTVELQAIPDWRFLIAKAVQSKAIKHAYAEVVYEGDGFIVEYGLEPILRHIPKFQSKTITHAYCIYILPDGNKNFVVMDKMELDAIKARAKTQEIWQSDEGEMCKKTVVKRALKQFEGFAPELSLLLKHDNEITGIATPEPIAMPTVIEEEQENEQVIEAQEVVEEQASNDEVQEIQELEENKVKPHYTGKIKNITCSEKKDKDGKIIKRWVLYFGEDEIASVWNERLANLITEAKNNDLEIRLWIEQKGKWRNIKEAELVSPEKTDKEEEPLPF